MFLHGSSCFITLCPHDRHVTIKVAQFDWTVCPYPPFILNKSQIYCELFVTAASRSCSDIPLLVASTRFKDSSDPDTSQSHRDEIQLLFQQSTTIAFSNEEVIGVSSEQFWNEIPDLKILKERPFIVRIGESWVTPACLEIGVTPK